MRLGHCVSPPWFGFALATATGFCALISVPIARSRPKPRLAYTSRSWCTTFVWSEISDLVGANSQVRKSGGREPAVVQIRACNNGGFLRTD
jgi:hypothetical protein